MLVIIKKYRQKKKQVFEVSHQNFFKKDGCNDLGILEVVIINQNAMKERENQQRVSQKKIAMKS